MRVTQADLIAVLQEESIRRTTPLIQNYRPQSEVAYEIGVAVRDAMNKLFDMGYLPIGLPRVRDIHVDYDRMSLAPKFKVTLRW